MMRKRWTGGLAVMGLGLIVSWTWACPGASKTAAKDGSAPCAKAAKLTADKATKPCDKPCSKKADAKLTADKDGKPCNKPCSKQADAKLTSAKKGCSKKCAKAKGAKLTAGKAGCNKKKCSKNCAKKASLTSAKGDTECPLAKKVQAVLASLPSMTYRVGDEVTECSKAAAQMAEKSGLPIEYVVGDEVFTDKGAALERLAAVLEKEANELQTVQFVVGQKCVRCPVTAKKLARQAKGKMMYRVGGVDFASREQAEAVLAAVKDAVKDVGIAYKVGDKVYRCSKKAGEKCKKNGAKLTYIVGDEETSCPKTAKVKLAKLKVRKIVETAVAKSFSS
ncbi:MAG: hypothetical protein D6788_10570 [Planctomycetota bacterium]|nr:MAG: hypothetical protein D6788_10570 [Planctomycetota bacterium]